MVKMAKISLCVALSTLAALGQAHSSEQPAGGSPVLRGNRRLQDSTCSNGFAGYGGVNDNGEACCPLDCGLCGGEGCGAGGRSTECCINGVLNNQEDCSDTNPAPCKIPENDSPAGGYLGCFQDGKSDFPPPPDDPMRIFSDRMDNSDEMDAEFCKGLCEADGGDFDYYGTQFGTECWCGAGTAAETYLRYEQLDDTACDVACAGDSTEFCGGSTIMSVYAFGDVDTTTPSPVTPTPAPVTDGQTCSNGFAGYGASNDNGEACCPLDCGLCGGVGCGAGGRSTECCINGVLNNQAACSDTNAAPCIVTDVDTTTPSPVTPTPAPVTDGQTCSNGFAGYGASNDNGEACCPLDCGLCGGVGCGAGGRSTECCINGVLNNQAACSDTNAAPCIVTDEGGGGGDDDDACNPNPCNLGSCALDPGGGHICTCPAGWGGMSCQTDTTELNEFKIELTFTINPSVANNKNAVWTDDEMADFREWADKWENVITHVPCGDGILPIEAEWTSNFVLNPPSPRDDCPQISSGGKLSNSKGLKAWKESDGVWESFVTHEMGHGVGFGYLWGKCNNCVIGDPEPLDGSWKPDVCPATYSAWLDLSGEPDGTVANIVETDIVGLTGECVHFDYDAIPGELNNKGTTHIENEGGVTAMSKLTLAALEDIGYIVDPSKADPFEIVQT